MCSSSQVFTQEVWISLQETFLHVLLQLKMGDCLLAAINKLLSLLFKCESIGFNTVKEARVASTGRQSHKGSQCCLQQSSDCMQNECKDDGSRSLYVAFEKLRWFCRFNRNSATLRCFILASIHPILSQTGSVSTKRLIVTPPLMSEKHWQWCLFKWVGWQHPAGKQYFNSCAQLMSYCWSGWSSSAS